jgi:hypothetical protein
VANLDLSREVPTAANVTVKAPRDYLTEREVEKLMDVARENRWGHRDATAISYLLEVQLAQQGV